MRVRVLGGRRRGRLRPLPPDLTAPRAGKPVPRGVVAGIVLGAAVLGALALAAALG